MPSVSVPDTRELMQAGVHFGHSSGRWHPKMKPYIFATRDKLHIINLEKTKEQLETVLPILEQRARDGKLIVLVGTKKQASPLIAEMGKRLGIPFVSERWLGGTMTNWSEIQQSIARMKRAEEILSTDEADKMIKKERVALEADLKRMHIKYDGIRDLTRKPDVLFVVDPRHEHNAMKECRDEGLEIFGYADTNSDPSQLDHVIPANDDGPKALKLVLGLVEQAVAAGLTARGKDTEKAVAEKTEQAEKPEVTTEEVATEEVTPKAEKAAKPKKEAK
jgi:small subunit ribosomal protein S2